jgi:hypothetical protein
LKRLLVVAALSVAALFLCSSPGGAQTTTQSIVRGTPLQVTSKTTPKRDRTRPYTFTTTGTVRPPARYCAPNVNPGRGAANCIPIRCPAGATNIAYCDVPGVAVICSGIVNVRYQKRTTTVSSRNVKVRANCTYRSRVSFNTRLPTRVGVLRVRSRFQGNVVMTPRNSSTHTVRAR